MLEEDSIKDNTAQIQLQLSNEAATYLLNEKRSVITDIEQRQHISIIIIPNPNIMYPNYQIKRLRKTEIAEQSSKPQTSYKMLETSNAEMPMPVRKVVAGKPSDQPVVKNLLSNMAPAPIAKKPMQGLIKRLWSSMFGATATKDKEADSGRGAHGGRRPHQRKAHHKPRQRRPQSATQPLPQSNRPSEDRKPPISNQEPQQQPRREYQKPSERSQEAPRSRDSASRYKREQQPRSQGSVEGHRRREERPVRPEQKPQRPETPPEAVLKVEPIEQPKAPKPFEPEKKLSVSEDQAPIIVRPEVKKETVSQPTSSRDEFETSTPKSENETEK
jgi:ribonuclease E